MPPNLIRSLLQLTRFWNLGIIALTQYCTAVFLMSVDSPGDWHLFVLSLSTILVAAAGYIINDYYDVKIDLINKPERVVIGNQIPRRHALVYHILLSMMGAGLGFLLNWKIGIFNAGCSFLLWLYSNALKRLPFVGNFTVALLTGLSVLIVNLLYPPFQLLVVVYSLFAFSITLVREIIKDLEDLKGDNTFGCKTLPIVWGIRRTVYFVNFLMALFILAVVGIHLWIASLPAQYFAWCLLFPILVLLVWLSRADTRKDFYRISQFCKLIMLAGILSMAFL
jgi:4-hydroxybenzoate polyprenyltransferase